MWIQMRLSSDHDSLQALLFYVIKKFQSIAYGNWVFLMENVIIASWAMEATSLELIFPLSMGVR